MSKIAVICVLALAILGAFGPVLGVAGLTCTDMIQPTLGNDTVPAIIPAAPKLLSPGTSQYQYAIDAKTDDLLLYLTSYPGIGDQSSFGRKLNVALTPQNVTTFPTTVVPSGCLVKYSRFALNSLPNGITVSNSSSNLINSATCTAPTCYFNHAFRWTWKSFRDSLGSCGFNITTIKGLCAYKGRIHVQWEDSVSVAAANPVRVATATYYDIVLSVQNDVTAGSGGSAGKEVPYLNNFQLNDVTYTKDDTGLVKASFAYSISTNYPYQAQLPSVNARDHLLSDLNAGIVYAGLRLGDSASFPAGSWSHAYINGLDGTKILDGTPCDAATEICELQGVLTYSWIPTSSAPSSCSISTNNSVFQWDFNLGCDNGLGASNACGKKMRTALGLPNLAQFRIVGTTDFCSAPTTSFPISWIKVFDVESKTRNVGQAIRASGQFRIDKAISAVAVKEFSVSRGDLSGSWQLWNAASDSAIANSSTGVASTLGVDVAAKVSITSSDSGFTWDISASYTPNIKLLDALAGTLVSTALRPSHMIVLPDDIGKDLSFTALLALRLYSDPVQNNNGARLRRRLVYRDLVQGSEILSMLPKAAEDLVEKTSPVSVSVPGANANQSGLSIGLIVGVAVAGCAAALAVTGGAFLYVRGRRTKDEEVGKSLGKEEEMSVGDSEGEIGA